MFGQERHDYLHAGIAPAFDFIVQPLAASWPREDCKFARPRGGNSIDNRFHNNVTSSVTLPAVTDLYIDSAVTQDCNPVVAIDDGSIRTSLESAELSGR